MRPVLDCRMPTLASKAAFYLPLDEMPTFRKKIHGLKLLESHPPRSVKDLRNIISSEIKAVSKKLSRLERSYYGIGKSIQHEVDKYVMPLKGVMRMLTIFEFSSVSTIENAIKTGSDPKRYKDACTNIRAAMTVMNTWLQADENYPIFLRNDIDNMEQLKEEKIKLMRAAKTKYHSATYKLTQTEVEYDKAIFEVESVKEKEEALTIEADYLRNLQNELRMELEIKEFRKDELKKKQSEFTPENYYEVFDMLTEEASSDYAEKIYFSLPIGPRCKIQPYVDGPDDKLDQACAKLSQIIQQDWMLLYRNLPFYPKRGSQTIEKDIAETREEGSRGLTEDCARIALARWRRHHTRAKTDDLVDALKKIKRLDGVKAVDSIVNPPQVEHVTQEIYIPPSIGPELVPFYKECERYDQLRASHKVRTER
ncbi:hypothetical protein KUTeg_003529 [Tegillarca granosa]|uniref:Death domain-containing protein n=1 Tax=Tegillarca granosa TaxID=220873 RepID=A0ABQ9FME0_TEGGR|nr:hypothetical protein KUTeg_003529 [Tegillarca granosa]